MREELHSLTQIGEEYTYIEHESGLRVYLIHKDLHTGYGVIGVPFGSLFEDCLIDGEPFRLPDGTAHFLEHKMFENPDGIDTFARFAAVGSDANAFTGNAQTCYLFSTVESCEEALKILLDSLSTPYFTEKNVKKEKGIILQELKMYRDDTGERIMSALYSAMYEHCRVKKDICGSICSVRRMTPEDLSKAYDRFYDPSNMILVLCGRFDETEVKKIIDDRFSGKTKSKAPLLRQRIPETLPLRVKNRKKIIYADVTTPVLSIGIKLPTPADADDGYARQKAFYLYSFIADALFSPSEKYVASMQKDNLLPAESTYEVVYSAHFSHITFEALTYTPEEAVARFEKHLANLLKNGITQEIFERQKKILYAGILENFESCESIAHFYLSNALDGIDPTVKTEVLSEITLDEINEALRASITDRVITRLISLSQSEKKQKE